MKQPGPLVWFEHNASAFIEAKPREFVDFDTALKRLKGTKRPFEHVAPQQDEIRGEKTKGWLDGKRVLDLTNVIAGPHSAAFLGLDEDNVYCGLTQHWQGFPTAGLVEGQYERPWRPSQQES